MPKKSFKIRGNLAQALEDTVNSATNHAGELHIEVVPLRKIELDPENPRDLSLRFEDLLEDIKGSPDEKKRKRKEIDELSSMVHSIHEQGVINPVVVYKHGLQYRLIAGERRTLASIIAKKTDIPAKVLSSKPNPLKLSLLQWIENIEREDLSLWERFRNLQKIVNAYAVKQSILFENITATDLTKLLGCSLQQGVNYRNLLSATGELLSHIENGSIKNIEKAALIAKSPENRQSELIVACLNGNTLSEMKKMLKNLHNDNFTRQTGRPVSKINLGSTKNLNVAKAILESVIQNKDLEIYTTHIKDVSWNDPKSISSAFRQLIKLLEQA